MAPPGQPPPPPPSRPGRKEIMVVRALYPYTAQRPDELSFEEGSILYVLNKDDTNWWKCRCGDIEGMVPSNYVGENTAQIDNPLHEASKRGNVEFVKELLGSGVTVNGLDMAGNTPLHWACRGGHLQVIQLLLSKKPALNAQNKLGDCPLHLASWGGHFEAVKILVSQPEIELTLKNHDGKTPFDLAKGDDIAAFLLQTMSVSPTLGPDELSEDDD